jgi:hypothetical protein
MSQREYKSLTLPIPIMFIHSLALIVIIIIITIKTQLHGKYMVYTSIKKIYNVKCESSHSCPLYKSSIILLWAYLILW